MIDRIKHLYWRAGRSLKRRVRLPAHRRALARSTPACVRELKSFLDAGPRPAIVVGHCGLLGDVVSVEPISRRLRELHPDHRIAWCVRPATWDLIRHNPHIDHRQSVTCLTQWLELRSLVKAPHRVIDLNLHGGTCPICNSKMIKTGDAARVTVANYHEFEPMLRLFCISAGLEPFDDSPRVYVGGDDVSQVDRLNLPNRFVALHTRSTEAQKHWEDEKWRAVVERLHALQIATVEVGLEATIRSTSKLHINLCGQLSVLQTAEVIRRALLFTGIDSGPGHLANATATPGVILLGPFFYYRRFQPYSGRFGRDAFASLIYDEHEVKRIDVDRVWSEIERRLPAR